MDYVREQNRLLLVLLLVLKDEHHAGLGDVGVLQTLLGQ